MCFGYTVFSHANDSNIKHLLSSFERFCRLSSLAGKEKHISVVHILKWLDRYLFIIYYVKTIFAPASAFSAKTQDFMFSPRVSCNSMF